MLDHVVAVPGAEPALNPMRVLPFDADRCELVFTLRRWPGMSEAQYEADAAAVAADLMTLKTVDGSVRLGWGHAVDWRLRTEHVGLGP